MVGFKDSILLSSFLRRSGLLAALLILYIVPVRGQTFSLLPDSTEKPRFNWGEPARSNVVFRMNLPKSYTEIRNLPTVIKPTSCQMGDLWWSFHPIQGTAKIRYEITPLPLKDVSFGFSKTRQVYENGQNLLRPRFLRTFFEFSEPDRTELFFLWQIKNLEILTTLQTGSVPGSAEPRFNPQRETLTIRLTYRF